MSKAAVGFGLILLAAGWMCDVIQQYRSAARLEDLGAVVTWRHGNVEGISFRPESAAFTDVQMPLLSGLRYLDWVRLDDTSVTSDGLGYLPRLPRLRHLSVRVDQISTERERQLLAAMPTLTVEKLWVIDGRKVVDGFQ